MTYCKIKNEYFKNFIYLNGGWMYYEKCPVCSMRLLPDGSNHKEFWDSHVENNKLKKLIEISKSINGVEIVGNTRDDRIKYMKSIFKMVV